MKFAIFFDDGGVLNDNDVRGPQWQELCGEFFHSKFGGDPEVWGDANYRVAMSLADVFWRNPKGIHKDYISYYADFKSEWVKKMFEEVGRSVPPKKEHETIFDATVEYIWPKVRSAIPGIIKSIKNLYSRGFILYTSTGLDSKEIRLVLEGMGIKQFFTGFYGPDLINTRKQNPKFFELVFKEAKIDSSKAIVIEDRPEFIKSVLKTGAHVIQACITGEFAPQFPFYVENMYELPNIIDNLIKTLNL
ncbi:MAG: HAD family hydrolase [Candidatus Hermodarchaeota archaeon]